MFLWVEEVGGGAMAENMVVDSRVNWEIHPD